MPWFRVDDDLATHPKAITAGNTALGLWVRAGAYSAHYLTEGFIPDGVLALLGGRPRDAAALVTAGLWTKTTGGWRFHQWEDRQPSKAQVEADREAAAERQRRARAKARESHGKSRRDVPPPVTRDSRSPRPGPAQTPYLLTLVSRLAAGDSDGPPAETIAAWQDLAGPRADLEAEAAAYLSRHGDRPPRDERGAWLGWLRKAHERTTPPPAAAQQPEQACPEHPGQPAGRCRDCEGSAVRGVNLRDLVDAERGQAS